MSGAGEAALVLGLITSVIAIFETAHEIYEAADNVQGLPKKLRAAADQIPLVCHALNLAKENLKKNSVGAQSLQTAMPVIERCENNAETIRDLFEKTIPTKEASKTERMKKAMSLQAKSGKIKERMEEVAKDMVLLGENQVFQNATVLEDIKEAVVQLDKVTDEDKLMHNTHSGSGDINASTVYGNQKTYKSAGTMYNAERQYFGGEQVPKEQRCHQIFKTSSYEAYKDRNPSRVQGTCEWVLNHPQFQDWRHGDQHCLLWISADPGCGKSVLSKSLADQDLQAGGQEKICYFFFKDNDEQDNLAVALCALLHQLFDQQPHLIDHAISAWEKDGAKLQHECRQLWRILLSATADQSARPTICILDALDECRDRDRRQLIELLCELQIQALRADGRSSLKFVVTSRPYDNVQRWFDDATRQFPEIRLRGEDENETIHQEINLVIQKQVEDLASKFTLSDKSRTVLQDQLLQVKHRTYLWLHLAIEEARQMFADSLYPDEVTIPSVPSSVEDAYERLLKKITTQQRTVARDVLLIIVGARRPLTIVEMASALGAARACREGGNSYQTT